MCVVVVVVVVAYVAQLDSYWQKPKSVQIFGLKKPRKTSTVSTGTAGLADGGGGSAHGKD